MVYSPSPPVVASRVSPVATLVAVTFASLMTAPFGSVTVPVIVPLLLWAVAGKTKAATHRSAAAHIERRTVLLSLFMSEPRMFKECLTAIHRDLAKRARTRPSRTQKACGTGSPPGRPCFVVTTVCRNPDYEVCCLSERSRL